MIIPNRYNEHNYRLYQFLREMENLYEQIISVDVLEKLTVCKFSIAENYRSEEDSTAMNWYQKSIEPFKELIQLVPSNLSYKYFLAKTYYELGFFFKDKNDKSSALKHFELGQELFDDLIKLDPNNEVLLRLAALTAGNIVYTAEDFVKAFDNCYKAKDLFHQLVLATNEQDDNYIYSFCHCYYDIGFMCCNIKNDARLKEGGFDYYNKIGIENLDYCIYMLDWIRNSRPLTDKQLELYGKTTVLLKDKSN